MWSRQNFCRGIRCSLLSLSTKLTKSQRHVQLYMFRFGSQNDRTPSELPYASKENKLGAFMVVLVYTHILKCRRESSPVTLQDWHTRNEVKRKRSSNYADTLCNQCSYDHALSNDNYVFQMSQIIEQLLFLLMRTAELPLPPRCASLAVIAWRKRVLPGCL